MKNIVNKNQKWRKIIILKVKEDYIISKKY